MYAKDERLKSQIWQEFRFVRSTADEEYASSCLRRPICCAHYRFEKLGSVVRSANPTRFQKVRIRIGSPPPFRFAPVFLRAVEPCNMRRTRMSSFIEDVPDVVVGAAFFATNLDGA